MATKKKKIKSFIIEGKGTKAELNARMRAIESGKELLPDGSKYSGKPGAFDVKLFWEEIFEYDYTKASKQLLDSKWRNITEDDLQRNLPVNIERGDVKVAIKGGMGALSFDVLEQQILHAFQTIFSRADYPLEIDISRPELYEAMGLGSYIKDGKKRYLEGPYGKQREKIHNAVLAMARKTYLFMFSQKTGEDKRGRSLYRMGLTYESIFKTIAIYKDIRQLEFKGMGLDSEQKKEPPKKRFSHYKVRFNPNAIGEVDKYYRYLPSGFIKEVIDYQKSKKGRASSYEIAFIEYLYTESKARIEIDYMKLAGKLRIKDTRPKQIRVILNRCYETAKDLNFLLKFETDQPGLRVGKDIFHLNPKRFKYLK